MSDKNTSFIYKSREEKKLIEEISSLGMITQEELYEIKQLYSKAVPYHNFVHVLSVARGVLCIPTHEIDIYERRSLFLAALFHDAGHTGTVGELDEFRSLDMAFEGVLNFEQKSQYEGINYSIIRKAIIGTVFKNRSINKDIYALILADLDVSTLGMSFSQFLYYSDFPFCIECGGDIENWLQDVNFFKFLTGIEKRIFRTECIRNIYPQSLSNIKKYLSFDKEKLTDLFEIWKSQDITFTEFDKYYRDLAIEENIG